LQALLEYNLIDFLVREVILIQEKRFLLNIDKG